MAPLLRACSQRHLAFSSARNQRGWTSAPKPFGLRQLFSSTEKLLEPPRGHDRAGSQLSSPVRGRREQSTTVCDIVRETPRPPMPQIEVQSCKHRANDRIFRTGSSTAACRVTLYSYSCYSFCNRVETVSVTLFSVPCGGAALDPMSRPRRPHHL